MPKKRVTIGVAELLESANSHLKRKDKHATDGFKSGVCNTIEWVLHQTGNYRGFMFLEDGDNIPGSPGYFTRKYF